MSAEQALRATEAHVRALLEGEGTGHDWWHVQRVRQNALLIAREEPVDLVVVELAVLLHDIADWKFNDGDELAGSRAARSWLATCAVDAVTIDHVCAIIEALSFKGAHVQSVMSTREGMVVQDADRLDAIGAIGIGRAFAYGGFRSRPLHDPASPPRMHSSFEEYRASQGTTINHFYEKLLLLRDRMHTGAARRIAAERHAFLETFLDRFLAEWDGNG